MAREPRMIAVTARRHSRNEPISGMFEAGTLRARPKARIEGDIKNFEG